MSVPGRRYPRGVKRKMSNFPLRPRRVRPLPPINIQRAIKVVRKPCRRLKWAALGLSGICLQQISELVPERRGRIEVGG